MTIKEFEEQCKDGTIKKGINLSKVMENLSDEDEISKVKELLLGVKEGENTQFFEEELNKILKELPRLRELMIDRAIGIPLRARSKDGLLNINLNNITEQLKKLNLDGVDLSKEDLEKFFKEHGNLFDIMLCDCNISNLKFLDFLPKELDEISLAENPIPAEYADDILRYRAERFKILNIFGCSEILDEFEKRGYELSTHLTKNRGKLDRTSIL